MQPLRFRNRTSFKKESYFIAITLLLFCITSCQSPTVSEESNIILFLVDDMGWTDASFMGSEYYETPHIDALANQGMIFTNAYANAPNCAPSRASILSGRYPTHHGIYTVGSSERGKAIDRKLIPVTNTTRLSSEYYTMAEMLRESGYATCHIGKWHLGDDSLTSPEAQGFDVNIGGNHTGHPKTYFSPYRNPNLIDGIEGEYLTDRLTNEALSFIDKNQENPFFLYFSHYAVHTPIQGKEALVDKYKNKRSSLEHDSPTYAAMVESVDQSLGRLLDKLNETHLAENTLILFFSDNGGHGAVTFNLPLRGSKGMLYEGGIRVPMIAWYPEKIAAKVVCEEPVIGIDFYPTFMDIASNNNPELTLDGESLLPLFYGESSELSRDAIYWHFPAYLEGYQNIKQPENLVNGIWRASPSAAIRMGDWKLIEYFEEDRFQLFNLKNDIGEHKDLFNVRPEVAQVLQEKMRSWRMANHADMPVQKTHEIQK